jgi:hypothetical protein
LLAEQHHNGATETEQFYSRDSSAAPKTVQKKITWKRSSTTTMQQQKHSSEAIPKKAVHTAANYAKNQGGSHLL